MEAFRKGIEVLEFLLFEILSLILFPLKAMEQESLPFSKKAFRADVDDCVDDESPLEQEQDPSAWVHLWSVDALISPQNSGSCPTFEPYLVNRFVLLQQPYIGMYITPPHTHTHY